MVWTKSERELFNRILSDIDGADKIIVSKYTYTQKVVDVLDSVWDYEIKDYIGKAELNSNRRYVINKYLNSCLPQVELKYYNYEEAIDFIEYAVNDIIERLSGKSDITKIL